MADEEAAPSPRGRRSWLRKKNKRRLLWLVLIAFLFIFYRGMVATTKNNFDCDYSILYAVCTPKFKNAEFPGLWDILNAGAKF